MSYSGSITTDNFKIDYHFNDQKYSLILEISNNHGYTTSSGLFFNKHDYETWNKKIHDEYKLTTLTEQQLIEFTLHKIFDYINSKYNEHTHTTTLTTFVNYAHDTKNKT
jgi:hypothetical protein